VSGVAPLLEAVDTAVSSTPGEATIGLLFERLVVLESQLSAWLRTHLQHPGTENNSLEHTPPTRRTNPNVFDLTCESLCRISLLLAVESLDDLLKYHSHHHHDHSQPNHNFSRSPNSRTLPHSNPPLLRRYNANQPRPNRQRSHTFLARFFHS
jgi:hypothetical protein